MDSSQTLRCHISHVAFSHVAYRFYIFTLMLFSIISSHREVKKHSFLEGGLETVFAQG
jgi:hypothetical protein